MLGGYFATLVSQFVVDAFAVVAVAFGAWGAVAALRLVSIMYPGLMDGGLE